MDANDLINSIDDVKGAAMDFEKYPFERLQELFAPLARPSIEHISLTIGEPQFNTPKPIIDTLCAHAHKLNKYPNSRGEKALKDAIIDYIIRRYKIALKDSEVVLTFGTREVLFNLPQYLLFDKNNPTMAFPNPFYQIYEGAAKMTRSRVVYMNLTQDNAFTPSLDKRDLESVDLVILNSPNNPTGKALSLQELSQWVQLALEYNFVILSDECYAEIYDDTPPVSILEASRAVGNTNFKNILAINSISKRSSSPGLRSGYVAGDCEILKGYMRYRTYLGCAVPLPLQEAAIAAWSDDESPKMFRDMYRANLDLARTMLNVKAEPYSFYLWLYVYDDIAFTKYLYESHAISVLPGRFLGRDGAGKGFVRIALVHETNHCKEALTRLSYSYENFMKKA